MTVEERRETLKECQKKLWDWMSERDRDIFNRVKNEETYDSIAFEYKTTVPSIRSTYNKVAKDMMEIVDFDAFRVICNSVAICLYGMDAVKVAEKRKKHKKKKKGKVKADARS